MSSEFETGFWKSSEYGNLTLVKAVQKRPCLYNNTLPEYSNKDVTRAAWQEIANEVGFPVSLCKKNWMAMRGAYLKDKAKMKKGKKKVHFLAEHLKFIDPFRIKSQQDSINRVLRSNIVEVLQKDIAKNLKDVDTETSRSKSSELNSNKAVYVYLDENGISSKTVSDIRLELNETTSEVKNTNDGSKLMSSKSCAALNSERLFPASSSHNNSRNQSGSEDCTVMNNTTQPIFNYGLYSSENPRTQFITSLQPEIEGMTEVQFRKFKRKLLGLIDDIKLDIT